MFVGNISEAPIFLADEEKEQPGLRQNPATGRLGIKNHHRHRYKIRAVGVINYNSFNTRGEKKKSSEEIGEFPDFHTENTSFPFPIV